MKNTLKIAWIITIVAVIGSLITACASMTIVDVEWDTLEGPGKARQYLGIGSSEVKVYAMYKDGVRRLASAGSVRYDKDTIGTQTVTVSLSGIAGGSFQTEVMELTGIRVEKQPAKTSYYAGETVALSGIKVMGMWKDMPDAEIPASQLNTDFDLSAVGNADVTINYNGKTAMFPVTVTERPVVQQPAPATAAVAPAPEPAPAAQTAAPAATPAPAAAPAPVVTSGPHPQPGLYFKAPPISVGDTPIEGIAANDVAAAITRFNLTGAANDGAYTLVINQDVTLTAQHNLLRANRQLTIIGIGQERTITGSAAGAFRFNTGNIVLTLGENITIKGSTAPPTNNLISVSLGSTLIMKAGSKITGFNSTSGTHAPVYVGSSTFTMDGGEISGNSISIGNVGTSSGVLLSSGATFNMNGGSITKNTMVDTTARGNGGGVGFQSSGQASDITLNMNGGTITGNTRNGQPMDVHIPDNARNIFNYNGGTIGAVFNKTGDTAPRP